MRIVPLLLMAIIIAVTPMLFADEGVQFVPHGQRSEIRYHGFYTVLHTCAVDGDKVVVFSRGEHLVNGEHRYLGIFAHTVKPNKKSGSKPKLHFKGIGGSWGANALDSVWPGDAQDSRKKFGLLFAALTPDYDGTPAKFVLSPFNKRGGPFGDQVTLHEIEESADNGAWIDTSSIAATMGPESIGVAFSYVIRIYDLAERKYDYQSRAWFMEFDFLGQPISELRQIELTSRDGRDVMAQVYRPAWIDGRWVVPLTSRTIQDEEVQQDQLRTAVVTSKKIKARTIDSDNVTNIRTWSEFVFSNPQFLATTSQAGVAELSRYLFVQRRDYSPTIKPDVRLYDTYYYLYNIDAKGTSTKNPKRLKLPQWVPKMEAKDRLITQYTEEASTAQPIGNNTYFFVLTRQAELTTRDKYQFSELEGDILAFSFNTKRKKITPVFEELGSDDYFSRIAPAASLDLMRLDPSGSLAMPHYCVEEGYSQERRSWLDLLRFDPVDAPSRPSARADHAMAYSPDSETTLIFGGANKAGLLGDLWSWDGNVWREVDDGAAPEKRARHAMVYDEAREKFVLFGGNSGSGELGDTWLWDGAKWTESKAKAPFERQGHAMAYCSSLEVTYLFGGRSGDTFYDDLWTWNGRRWRKVSAAAPPSPRTESTIAWDPDRKRLILAGGIDASGGIDETWEFNPADSTWVQIEPDDPFPDLLPMGGSTATYFTANETLYLFGGFRWDPDSGYQSVRRDLQRYQPQEFNDPWRTVYTATWIPARTGHAAVYDSVRKQIIVFGGWDDGALMADTWLWDGKDWFNIMP